MIHSVVSPRECCFFRPVCNLLSLSLCSPLALWHVTSDMVRLGGCFLTGFVFLQNSCIVLSIVSVFFILPVGFGYCWLDNLKNPPNPSIYLHGWMEIVLEVTIVLSVGGVPRTGNRKASLYWLLYTDGDKLSSITPVCWYNSIVI